MGHSKWIALPFAGPNGQRMDDLGDPISPLVVADGTPVYGSNGERAGVVDRVMMDGPTGIFEGIIVHTLPLPGRHVFADAEQIAELHERGVLLSVEADELHPLDERSNRRRGSSEAAEPPLERRLRKAWDWITAHR
jgi:hypothetical protein